MVGYMRCNMPKPGSSRFLTFAKNTLLSNCIGKKFFFTQIDILVLKYLKEYYFLKMKQI